MRIRHWQYVGPLAFMTFVALGSPAPAQDEAPVSGKEEGVESHCGPGATHVTQTFPIGGAEQTRWEVCFQVLNGYGLVIQDARYRKSPASPFITVLNDGRVSEIFTVYHPGAPRFFDVSGFFFPPEPLNASHCPASVGTILGGNVCQEVRDAGILWNDDQAVRRRGVLRLWNIIDAANYNYIPRWEFYDDGTIVGALGASGHKLGGPDDSTGHMHTVTWRLDIDLNGPAGDSVRRTKHKENLVVPPSTATDTSKLIMTESSHVWNDLYFTSLEISDSALMNGRGRPTSYELIPLREGTARHSEGYTDRDFWVTAFNAAEVNAPGLPTYLNGQSVNNADVVVWYTGGEHHENNMRDEDRQVVPVKWVAFELAPKNLHDGTPLFP